MPLFVLPLFLLICLLLVFYPAVLNAVFDCLGSWAIFGLFVVMATLGFWRNRRLRCPFCGACTVDLAPSHKRSSGHMVLSYGACKRKAVTDVLFYEGVGADQDYHYIQDKQFVERL